MDVRYDAETRTYSVTGLTARDVHILVWGGKQEEIDAAENRLRSALVEAEDTQMPEAHYAELFS